MTLIIWQRKRTIRYDKVAICRGIEKSIGLLAVTPMNWLLLLLLLLLLIHLLLEEAEVFQSTE